MASYYVLLSASTQGPGTIDKQVTNFPLQYSNRTLAVEEERSCLLQVASLLDLYLDLQVFSPTGEKHLMG